MQINTLIVVPARSGSKGLPDKNIKLLGGKPLLSWTAQAIVEAGLLDCLSILSTDSAIYIEVAKQIGLEAPFLRPADFATDTASAIQVAEHALDWFQRRYGYMPESLMWLQPTSPFRSPAILHQAWAILAAGKADAVIGCKEIHRDLTTLFRCDGGFLSPLDKTKSTQTTRQQLQPLLTPNGAMYCCKTAYLLEHKSFYPERTMPLIMNAIQSLDIDTEEDWAIAEAFIKQGLV
ncbi:MULTISPECIES: cytidylyltransferase domain-containing protein [Methylomonas]|uniref:N-acylneuraminate cytidylyltransferase n=2 Tax=Methylomonas TaxID=416 RepID=A0A126T6V1_9GAMM|nr:MULTISPECIES: acylneuraminate cytidylyltransferase family protein [Methylomonas]AMK77760.1 N-acylneuraminate cytidylyltransferase [Methylomonas denitrificans]OAI08658.1 N-acylneuraminate cytidylyltransferase [Methylomonas methanica]TCV86933.1 N-acylneuraminate cytidylyltransferase/CMP-N,N'-diacetyllegionaminic acid synthase [Methylomonas methanica]